MGATASKRGVAKGDPKEILERIAQAGSPMMNPEHILVGFLALALVYALWRRKL